jgi:alpha,alpha-trehalase
MADESAFAPLERHDGYLRLEDHGLIGDGETAALVGRDGAVSWLCAPRFHAPPLFAGILDTRRGGTFVVAPDEVVEARQRYIPDTAELVTEMRGPDGFVRVTDALTLQSGVDLTEGVPCARRELVRQVEVLDGSVSLGVSVNPRGGARAEPGRGGLELRTPDHTDLQLHLHSDRPLDGLDTTFDLEQGDRLGLVLDWSGHARLHRPCAPDTALEQTADVWRRWTENIRYDGPRRDLVRRSAITLKLLDHFQNGAIVAAPTSSLPEAIGGDRNWDYRYAWVRDVAFSVFALRRIGLEHEARGFLAWMLAIVEHGQRPKVLYDLDGGEPPPEWEDPDLGGYRRSAPVRWGNAAADQRQNDVYGEIVDCAYQWVAVSGKLDRRLWDHLLPLIERAAAEWREPDHGIWEVRVPGKVFTYSASICHVALDRAARIADRLGLPGDIDRWRKAAGEIADAILTEAWDPDLGSITEHLDGGYLDAGLLTLPLRRVVPADHPRMVATTEAVREHLDAGDGLLYRYDLERSPDGLESKEGAFLLCSFWLVETLALQGRLDEAGELYESLCDRATPLGLLSEQIDPATGAFLAVRWRRLSEESVPARAFLPYAFLLALLAVASGLRPVGAWLASLGPVFEGPGLSLLGLPLILGFLALSYLVVRRSHGRVDRASRAVPDPPHVRMGHTRLVHRSTGCHRHRPVRRVACFA